jgi:hypothetical protein
MLLVVVSAELPPSRPRGRHPTDCDLPLVDDHAECAAQYKLEIVAFAVLLDQFMTL